jgi:hypothetical protein
MSFNVDSSEVIKVGGEFQRRVDISQWTYPNGLSQMDIDYIIVLFVLNMTIN